MRLAQPLTTAWMLPSGSLKYASHPIPGIAIRTTFIVGFPGETDEQFEATLGLVADADFEDRSLGCIAQVPQGGMTWIMQGDDDSVLEATDHACSDALGALNGSRPLGLLARPLARRVWHALG